MWTSLLTGLNPILGSAVGFFQKNWKVIIGLAIVAACYFYVTGLQKDVMHWNTKYNEAVTAHALLEETCKNNEALLRKDIDNQNKKVEEMAAKLKQAQVRIDQLIVEKKKIDAQNAGKVEGVLAIPTATNCQEAIEYLIKNGKGVTWAK